MENYYTQHTPPTHTPFAELKHFPNFFKLLQLVITLPVSSAILMSDRSPRWGEFGIISVRQWRKNVSCYFVTFIFIGQCYDWPIYDFEICSECGRQYSVNVRGEDRGEGLGGLSHTKRNTSPSKLYLSSPPRKKIVKIKLTNFNTTTYFDTLTVLIADWLGTIDECSFWESSVVIFILFSQNILVYLKRSD
jgi:hypothetical protein